MSNAAAPAGAGGVNSDAQALAALGDALDRLGARNLRDLAEVAILLRTHPQWAVWYARLGIPLDPASTIMTRPAPPKPDLETTRLTPAQLAAARASITMIRDAAGLSSALAGRRPA